MSRKLAFWGLASVLVLGGCGREAPPAASAGDWRAEMKQVRMAVRGSEDDPLIARRWDAYKRRLEQATGLPVRLYESSDYNGTIQALSSGQVDLANIAGGGYANVEAQVGDLVAPVLTNREAEGSMGYYSAVLVRADSPYRSLADLKGKTLGYIDFNSTSGYLYPRSKMREQGVDPDTFFGKSTFAGGHTQAVMALDNGQFDAAIINVGGGDPVNGFTSGAHFTMARRGVVRVEDFRIIWSAGPIANAATVVRTDRPQAFIDTVRGAMASLPYDDPELWREIGQPDGASMVAVDRRHYADVIKLRSEDLAQRRGGGRP